MTTTRSEPWPSCPWESLKFRRAPDSSWIWNEAYQQVLNAVLKYTCIFSSVTKLRIKSSLSDLCYRKTKITAFSQNWGTETTTQRSKGDIAIQTKCYTAVGQECFQRQRWTQYIPAHNYHVKKGLPHTCLMVAPPEPMTAPTASLGTLTSIIVCLELTTRPRSISPSSSSGKHPSGNYQ